MYSPSRGMTHVKRKSDDIGSAEARPRRMRAIGCLRTMLPPDQNTMQVHCMLRPQESLPARHNTVTTLQTRHRGCSPEPLHIGSGALLLQHVFNGCTCVSSPLFVNLMLRSSCTLHVTIHSQATSADRFPSASEIRLRSTARGGACCTQCRQTGPASRCRVRSTCTRGG